MAQKGKILVLDEDDFSRNLYADLLREDGHTVYVAGSGKEALALIEMHPLDLLITEIVKPPVDGFEIIGLIQENHPTVDVLVATAYSDVEHAVKAFKMGVKDFLQKPVNIPEFKLSIRRILEQRSLFTENREFRKFLGLFDACHRISGCLEMERLIPLSLHALGQELQAQDGLAITKDVPKGDFQGYPFFSGKEWNLDEIVKSYCKNLKLNHIMELKKFTFFDDPPYPEGIQKSFILPIVIENKTRVLFFIFFNKNGSFSANFKNKVEQNAEFIGRQITLSIDNATKFNRARQQAFVDDLSGLYNARYLKVAMDRELKRSKRFGHPLSVLFLDLDHFKEINDQHGHIIGGKVLMEVAEILRSCLRDIDTAVRYGGDEYTIILVNTNSEGAVTVAERIRKEIETYRFLKDEGLNLKTSASIGIASFPEHAKTVVELLDMADQAMYRGKNTSRNVVYTFNPITS